jgi:Zn-dependent peptidase ImmA (M78 family)/DNA-binding XRE family transcriptional regulator
MLGERIKRARIKAGLSQDALVTKANNIVTKQAMSQYEKNQKTPSSQVLIAIANALNIKLDFFFRKTNVEIGQVDFRKHSSFGKKQQEVLKENVKDALERYLELEDILGINKAFENPLSNLKINSYEDAEKAAEELRNKWELGIDPITNIMSVIEFKDIKVIYIKEESPRFNGLSGWAKNDGNHPFIVINSNESHSLDRKRFTTAHELGHLLLEKIIENDDLDHEKVANRFAGAFLFPKNSVHKELSEHRNKISLVELVHLKIKYKMSIQAIMYRLKDLGIISESKYKSFAISNTKSKFDSQYPLKNELEEINRFENLLARAYSEEFISSSKLAELSGKNINEVLKIYGDIF